MSQQPTPGQVPSGPMTCYRHPGRETGIVCQRCLRPICTDCMTPAAVGFQCPSCVSEGRKSTRQGRATYGGSRSSDPRITTFALIGVNVAVWLAIVATGSGRSRILDAFALLPQTSTDIDAVGRPFVIDGVSGGDYWQLITSAFAHVDALHIGFNMLALFFLGPQLESALGRARFLGVYLTSALTGSAAVMWLTESNVQTVGASGAVFGMLGALLVLTLKVRGDARQLLMWLGLNVVLSFTQNGISWQGHLGGLVGGVLVAVVIAYAPRGKSRSAVQWAGVGVIALVAVLASVIRGVTL